MNRMNLRGSDRGTSRNKVARAGGWLAVLLAAISLSSCSGISSLNPAGPRAAEIAKLWWLMFAAGLAVYLLVLGVLLFALFRRRRDGRDAENERSANRWIIAGGIILPAVVLIAVYLYTIRTLDVLAAPSQESAYTIEVVGHQWWWEVRYPDEGIITANEIHVPVGQPVLIRLSSIDVIHSLWIPQLMDKLDLIPGKTNTIWMTADKRGTYLGECAEYCGTQHGQMRLVVVADEEDEYRQWMENERQPAVAPTTDKERAGQQVFLGAACVYCHRIQGTNATGNVGPDLTHLASRSTLGAGIMPNVKGNLAGWIVNSQTMKPGNRMPPMYLESADLDALLAYLGSLR
jgi:cytochrome c oxidase subunit II